MKQAPVLSFILLLDLLHSTKNRIKIFSFCLLLGGHFSCFGAQMSLEKQLDLAIREGNISEVQVLLTRPAIDVNVQDKKGRTALICAARNNSPELVRLLLAHPDIDVNVQANVNREAREGSTALMAAVSKSSKLVELFLKHSKIDVNVQDRGGSTALMYATNTNSPESVRLLLARPI